LPPPREYTVQAGDSLSKIAVKFGVTTRELMELNSLKDPNKIRVGQKLILPSYAAETPRPVKASHPKPASTPAGAGEYVVQKGDTLSGIAQKLGTTTRALIEANHIENPNSIRVGQKLVVPAGATKKEVAQPAKTEASAPPAPPAPPAAPEMPPVPPSPAPPITSPAPALQPSAPASTPSLGAGQTIRYPVGPGETLDSIAKTFLVTPEAILKANNLPDASAIKPGMTIQIPLGP
jgi:LysM repeat protein